MGRLGSIASVKSPTLNRKRRLGRAIDRFDKEVIDPIIGDFELAFYVQAGYLSAVIILIVISDITSRNFATFIGTLGLGSLGIGANYERLQRAMIQFLRDRRNLKVGVAELRLRLSLCEDSDAECLERVEKLLIKSYDAVTKKTKG